MKGRIVLELVKGGCPDCFFDDICETGACPISFWSKCDNGNCWQQVKEEEEKFCEWRVIGFEEGDVCKFETSCNNYDYYNSSNLPDNVRFCPYCGLKIMEVEG